MDKCLIKKGYVTLELVILSAIIIVFGITGYMLFTRDSKKVLDTSKGGMKASIHDFNVDTKTRNKK